jgi:hypothetical protein
MSHPASAAPTIPTTTLRKAPCCASVFMMRLAIQPMTPPTMSQMMKLIMITSFEG